MNKLVNHIMILRTLRVIIRTAELINETLGRLLSWFLPLMTAIMLTIIVCGSFFRIGWVWLGELVVYMHAILFMLCAAYTLRHDGHARIDIFYDKLNEVGKAWVNLGGVVFLLMPVCVVIFVTSLSYTFSSWEVMEHSPEGEGLPAVFLLKTCIPVAVVLLFLEGLAIVAKSILTIFPSR
ncbi:MAG: TRAP transporter small permease subunit [Gammaproteobacteria bacterium WSBS_2016_MAG_OTU1]